MAKYLFVYHGGGEPDTQEPMDGTMNAWDVWLAGMGSAVIDAGNPAGRSITVTSDGSIINNGGSNPASGYSLIEASDLDDACTKAKGCPILADGGSVEVAETIDV